jgi:hypothetical protein
LLVGSTAAAMDSKSISGTSFDSSCKILVIGTALFALCGCRIAGLD